MGYIPLVSAQGYGRISRGKKTCFSGVEVHRNVTFQGLIELYYEQKNNHLSVFQPWQAKFCVNFR